MSDPMPPVDPRQDPVVWPSDETRIQPPPNVPPPPPPGSGDDERSWFRRHLPWILVALLGVLILVGLGVWLLTRSSSGKPVPAVIGLRIDAAVNRLQDDGFRTQISRQANPRQAGIVFDQTPAGATSASKGSTVDLVVSNGPRRASVPNAVGLAQADGRDRLVQAGLEVTTAAVFSDQPAGTVVAQDPPAGARVAPGTKVRINVSKGSNTVAVPSEVGNTVDQAQSELTAKGLKPDVVSVPSDQPVDTVVAQSPAGGQVAKGSSVQLNVSDGTQTTTGTTTDSTVTTDTTTTDTTDTTDTTVTTSGSPG